MTKHSVLVLLLVACGGTAPPQSGTLANTSAGGAAAPAAVSCPVPRAADILDRFAVGAIPVHRVEGMVHGAKCYDVFVASDVLAAEADAMRIVKPGVFEGHCPGEADSRRRFEAVAAGGAIVEVNKLATHDGELGFGKAITLVASKPDDYAGVIAHPADACGERLSLGAGVAATWDASDCASIAKVVPYDVGAPPDATSTQQQIAPLGPGTCTLRVSMLGATGSVAITVR